MRTSFLNAAVYVIKTGMDGMKEISTETQRSTHWYDVAVVV
jgi:hypothetical protein